MIKRTVIYLVPVMMASLLLMVGCNQKSPTKAVAVEEDIVLDDGAVAEDWVTEEVVPIPPREPATVAGKRPSKDHIWVPGEWTRDKDAWYWKSGRWMKPPHKHASWMVGHWRMEGDKWHWSPGQWIVMDRPLHVTETIVPPEPLPEEIPAMPSDKNHWVAGYWDWDGQWHWVTGYWTSKPHPDAEWVPGHWDDFGMAGGYRWIGGHWRVKS